MNRQISRWVVRTAITALGILGILGLGAVVAQPGSDQTHPSPTAAPQQQAKMEEIRLTEIQDGVKKWILVAKRADYLQDQHLIQLTGVQVEVFWKGGDNIKLTGDIGYINTKTRELTLKGQIRAEVGEYRFEASQVSYIPKQRALKATGEVKIQGPQVIIRGRNLQVELDKKRLSLAEHKLTRCRLPEKIWMR